MKKSVYILEDNDDIREMLTYLLTEEDYNVQSYTTVQSFRQEMKYASPDMVVLDVMLSDGNGIDVCGELKTNKRTNHIPVLMMSANTHFSEIKNNCKAEDFISKPFDINDFIRKIDKYLH